METAIGVSAVLKIRLAAFKKTWNFKTFEDTLTAMLSYFEQVGDDPTNPQFTAKAQMVEMNKRLDQVVRFIRVFEKQKMQPMLDELSKQSRHVLAVLPSNTSVATKADVEELTELLQELPTHEELAAAVMKLYDVVCSKNTK